MAVVVVPYGLLLHRTARDLQVGDILYEDGRQSEVKTVILVGVGVVRIETRDAGRHRQWITPTDFPVTVLQT